MFNRIEKSAIWSGLRIFFTRIRKIRTQNCGFVLLIIYIYQKRRILDSIAIQGKKTQLVYLEWNNGRKQTLTSFSTLTVNLVKGERPFDFLAIIPPPNTNQEDEIITLD